MNEPKSMSERERCIRFSQHFIKLIQIDLLIRLYKSEVV